MRRRVHHEDPIIETIDSVVSPAEALHLQEVASPTMTDALVSGDSEGVPSTGRRNLVAWVRHDTDSATLSIADRIADLVGLPLANAESFQVIRYGVGGQYKAHFDAYDLTTERGQRCCSVGGQRVTTALGYLSEVRDGGSTTFPKIGLTIEPSLGRLLVFENCGGDRTRPHPLSLHSGSEVLAGEKWAFNLWFRERALAHAT